MEGLFGEEEGWRPIGSVGWRSGRGLSTHELIVDVGTQLVKLHRGQAKQLITSLVRWLFSVRVAALEEEFKGVVMLLEHRVVQDLVVAGAVAAAFASQAHARPADGRGRRRATAIASRP